MRGTHSLEAAEREELIRIQQETDRTRARDTHFLETTEEGTCQDTEEIDRVVRGTHALTSVKSNVTCHDLPLF